MAKFTTKIELPRATKKQIQQLDHEISETVQQGIRISLDQPFDKKHGPKNNRLQYNVEGNVTLQDLSIFVSKIASRISKDYTYTIIRNKLGFEY